MQNWNDERVARVLRTLGELAMAYEARGDAEGRVMHRTLMLVQGAFGKELHLPQMSARPVEAPEPDQSVLDALGVGTLED